MGTKNTRAGGKYCGNHTSVIPAAIIVCDIANKCPSVTRISPNFIKAGLNSVQGKRRVKITRINGGILIAIRDNTSHQQVYVYANDIEDAVRTITQGARNAGLLVSVAKDS